MIYRLPWKSTQIFIGCTLIFLGCQQALIFLGYSLDFFFWWVSSLWDDTQLYSSYYPEKEATLKKSQVAPYKNLGRFCRVPFKSLLRVQIKRAITQASKWACKFDDLCSMPKFQQNIIMPKFFIRHPKVVDKEIFILTVAICLLVINKTNHDLTWCIMWKYDFLSPFPII